MIFEVNIFSEIVFSLLMSAVSIKECYMHDKNKQINQDNLKNQLESF